MTGTDVWKVAIVADGESKAEIDSMITQLLRLGLDAVHVFSTVKTKVNKQRDIVVHHSPATACDYDVWRDAFITMFKAYRTQTDLFMFVRPRLRLWEQLPVYCESTIDRSIIGVWSPFTPTKLFPDEYPEYPTCSGEFGWCPSKVNRSLEANHCWIMTHHMVALMSTYLPTKPEIMGANTAGIIASIVAGCHIPYYFHTPSLAAYAGPSYYANDFVGVSHHLNQHDMRTRNFILTN